MPKAAAALGAASEIVPLDAIASRLMTWMGPICAPKGMIS
jgi:chemotaxis response regulator CheB